MLEAMLTRRLLPAGLALSMVGLVGCDHATKHAARAALAGGRVFTLVPGLLDLRYAENRSTAFSLLDEARTPSAVALLAALTALALVAIAVWWWRSRRAAPTVHVGFAFVVDGAIGNLGDRVARGFVVDFVHLRHWPIFNVADVAITLGVGLIALGALTRRSRTEPASS
ncbi:MAG: hypothetical protein NVS3B10_05080 [Polyangiales bacterium]